MKRRAFVSSLFASILLLPLALVAQPPAKVPRIGYLVRSTLISPPTAERAAFFEGMRELGYIEGKNLLVEYRSAEGDPEALPFLAAELVNLKVDLIVVAGAQPALAVRDASANTPVVMLFSPDPVGTGLIASLARPGGNVTGMSHFAPELGAKRLQLLKEAIPGVKRVAVLWDSGNFAVAPEWQATQAAARALNIVLQPVDIRADNDLGAAFAAIRSNRPDALVTILDLRTSVYRDIIPEFAMSQRLPTMFGLRDFAVAGGLISYAPNFSALSRRAASYVDRILKGAKPADLPVEQPTQFELVINLKTAKALGITMPQSILVRADKVIR